METATTAVEHKRHFLTLDGLRAVAAISVVLFHRRWWSPTGHFLDHAYLAVDFFFVLSGFVVGYAYDSSLRSGELSPGRFVLIRVIRLYPLVVLGAVIGATSLLWTAVHYGGRYSVMQVLVLLPLAAMALPTPRALASEPYPFNGPTWSLTCEIGANVVYGLLAKRLTTPILIAIALVSFLFEAYCAHAAGALGMIGSHFGPLAPEVARVTFPFTVGLLIYRAHMADRLPKLPLGFLALSLLTLASFAPNANFHFSNVYDLFCIAILYPMIVMAGCRRDPAGRFAPIARWGANISYPIYAIHYPLLMWLDTALGHFGIQGNERFAVFLLTVALIAWGCTYVSAADAAVRKLLSRRLLRPRLVAALGA